MVKSKKTVTIFGGTGFIGRYIVQDLAAKGHTIRVPSRTPQKAYFLRPNGVPGQIVPEFCDLGSAESIERAIDGSDYVINCIGILFEKGKNSFDVLHKDFPERLARLCSRVGTARFIHISALGIEKSKSKYAASKRKGEDAIMKAYPLATILRPSIVFGAEDSFFNMFAEMAQFLPALPLIGGGHTKFQPVYVGDVADAAVKALETKASAGQTYQLGGPEILTFRQLMERMFKYTKQPRPLISLPWFVARIQATVLSLLPKPLLTQDQITSLQNDNVVAQDAKTLADLGVAPTALDAILPTYLSAYIPEGRFAYKNNETKGAA